MPKKQTPKPRRRTPWNTSEILYSVFGYLTTRETPLILSAHYNAGAVAEIIGAIAKANDLPKCRNGAAWKKIHIPDGLEEITNVPKVAAADKVKEAETTPEMKFYNYLFGLTPEEQNAVIRSLLKSMQEDRRQKFDEAEADRKRINDHLERMHRTGEELLKLTGGNLIN
jgi:hypothetical protein